MEEENLVLNQCLEFTKAFLEQDERFTFNVKTSNGFTFSFENIGVGNPKVNEKKKSPSQTRRDKLRITKFNLNKGTMVNEEASGNPEEPEHSKVCEVIDCVTNSEVHYVTGEWVNAPEDSRSFNKLFKPIYEVVGKILDFRKTQISENFEWNI